MSPSARDRAILDARDDAQAATSEEGRREAEERYEALLREREEAELAAAEGRPVAEGDHRTPKAIIPWSGPPSAPVDHLGKPEPPRESVVVTALADVKAEPVEWLWPDRIPFGTLTLLDGDPSLGKSTLALDIAARVTTGREMPDGMGGGEPAGVLVVSAEDDIARTIRPRLEAARADLSRVVEVRLRSAPDDAEGRLPVVPFDIPEVEVVILERGIRLVVLDPLMALLDGEVNSFRDQDVRRALAPVAAMARRTGAAVLVVRHLNKSAGGAAIYRGGGSIGIAGAARAVLLLALDPDDPERRILAPVKSNLGPLAPSLAFRLEPVPGRPREWLSIRWQGASPLAADALLAAAAEPPEERGPREDAAAYLSDVLGRGPVLARDVRKAAAKDAGIADRTLDRAKRGLRVRSFRKGAFGDPGPWFWALPDEGAGAPVDRQDPRRSPTPGSGDLRQEWRSTEAAEESAALPLGPAYLPAAEALAADLGHRLDAAQPGPERDALDEALRSAVAAVGAFRGRP